MQGDFFQVLRRVQKEERNKSSLARVDNDFYKQLRDYIRDLERSVASDPFGNEQLLLNNAQRIATEICELRESKITKAANNNIYRSFLLFKKDNPQFDLLDTTPLNLTDEEETLYFSLMDALKNHRYRISLDEYTEDASSVDEEEDFDADEDETSFVEDSYKSSSLEDGLSDNLEDEIRDALDESDEVLKRLNEIKNAKVITDEKYESIERQVAKQSYSGQGNSSSNQSDVQRDVSTNVNVEVPEMQSQDEVSAEMPTESQGESAPEVQSKASELSETKDLSDDVDSVKDMSGTEGLSGDADSSKAVPGTKVSSGDINDIFKDPDSQFVDLDRLEPNYDSDYYNSIAAGSSYARPDEDDFNMIFAKPKKPKAAEVEAEKSDSDLSSDSIPSQGDSSVPSEDIQSYSASSIPSQSEVQSSESDFGFSSGLDVKEGKAANDSFSKDIKSSDNANALQELKKEIAPKKPVDKTHGGLFKKEEIENATVVIRDKVGELLGIDGKVYGPFIENDVVMLPNITAQILIDNNKASLVKL